ncbi:4-hydroxy-3-methylbut-2-en-1-yl diphosphate synthase [Candidatus Beckwithbacteria bacterium CG10_big_fil_rev_8_21_14_0_10_34_10]|uniref:4-hydroxy-3-methylbut-2-en-1-yl diphosphate synthase (flavodoxin) n=1 Tax=Candidatus Beckwithbacteria bacterium CG10_big_fil_rev_8_21_14_0_10_34_10 TaxID=1974495 RepID=A0A2H0W996_9BACT|nr:MAG: 4-hydroxy-3-methylbut-2-en-1-yl diphosphate synthase [Candidatus Beckwithbacteria bacterium CG10_big_fil_rev_8_21_14_0_10_34_10]
MIKRKKTKKIRVGNIYIGGNAPITVQTMVKTDAHDVKVVVRQIKESEAAGADITRMNVLDMESVKNFSKIKKQIKIPIVADIHFNYLWAMEAIKQGVDKLRINPGNIGGIDKVKKIVSLAKEREVPLRIGINAGSLEKDLLEKYGGHPAPEAMVESAARNIKILEDLDYDQIVVSLKASDIQLTIQAYQLFSQKYDYPLHLGVTEAGPGKAGIIKSSIGISSLLLKGIGDTLRVSLSADPTEEIKTGKEILKFLGLKKGPILISCPTCSRTQYNMLALAEKIENFLETIDSSIKVAVMGCVVNGPGEAREADVGIAGGKKTGALFVKGKIIKTIAEKEMFNELVLMIKKIIEKKEKD